jgi:hypothetical protein
MSPLSALSTALPFLFFSIFLFLVPIFIPPVSISLSRSKSLFFGNDLLLSSESVLMNLSQWWQRTANIGNAKVQCFHIHFCRKVRLLTTCTSYVILHSILSLVLKPELSLRIGHNVCVSAVVRFRSRVLSHETKR